MNKFRYLFLSVCFYVLNSFSQEERPLLSEGYLGYSMNNINFQPKGYSTFGAWEGVEVNFTGLTFSFHEGQYRKIGVDSTIANVGGSVFKIGYRLGPNNWTLGNNSFASVSVKPYMQISGSILQAKTKLFKDRINSAGLIFSPGIQVRFSHLYLSASYDAGLYMNSALGNGKYNLGKGFVGGTTITIGLDNAFDLLIPKLFSFKGYNIWKRTYTDSDIKYDYTKGQYYKETITTVVKKYSPGERSLALFKPYWGVGPTYSFKALKNRQASTSMKGINGGVRLWYLMVDGFYEEGSVGLKSSVDKDEILINYPILRDYDFSSAVDVKNYGVRVGFNLTKFFTLKMNFENTTGTKLGEEMKVPFSRVNVFYTQGVTEFLSSPNYTYEGGSSRLADYQSFNNISPDASNNPDYIPTTSKFSGWGASLEVGSVFFNATWYKYKDASIANHMNYTVGTNIPLGRILHSVRARFF